MKFPHGVRAPLIPDLQNKYDVHCTMDGRKGILVKSKDTRPKFGFAWDSGFVPFRKTNITNAFPQRQKITARIMSSSLNGTPETTTWVSSAFSQPTCWKAWKSTYGGVVDARDAIYLYSYKMKKEVSEEDVSNSLPAIYQSNARPHTVADTQRPDEPKRDCHGHRRSYTVIQRTKEHEVKTRKALLMKHGQKSRLTGENGVFFAVKQMFPCYVQSPCVEHKMKYTVRDVQDTEAKNMRSLAKLSARTDRPLKSEGGRYRPISRTVVKTPNNVDRQVSSTLNRDFQSAEAYKMIICAKKERLQQQRRTHNSVAGTPITKFRRTQNTLSCQYDTETRLLQSVIDVNKPQPQMASAQNAVESPTNFTRPTSSKKEGENSLTTE